METHVIINMRKLEYLMHQVNNNNGIKMGVYYLMNL